MRRPEYVRFCQQWQQKHSKPFDLTNEAEQEAFVKAVTEIATHIAHTALSVSAHTVLAQDESGLDSVFLKVQPR